MSAYTVACWTARCMKHGMLARLASPLAFPILVALSTSSGLAGWMSWKERRTSENPIVFYTWVQLLGLLWTFSFFVLHSVFFSLFLAILFTTATIIAITKYGGPKTVSGALTIPHMLWALMMLLMNAAFASFRLGLFSFGGLQWWGLKHIGWGLFHTAQHLLLG